jgi:adenylate kinase
MKAHGVPQVSTGDLLRDAVARGTELGQHAKAAMDAGGLVEDSIVLGMLRERLTRPDAANGFILDGYPRNIAQAGALENLLTELKQPLEAVVLMNLDLAVLFKRLTGRRICQDCGRCGDHPRLIQRPDDKEDVIGKRLEVYEAQTTPLIAFYRANGLLRVVDADADIGTVFASLQRAVGAVSPIRSL